jgi:L-alanine-DL-glutamate epimerase-like enolase superfamily enzyme
MVKLEPVLLQLPAVSARAEESVFLVRAISDDAVAYGEAVLTEPDLFLPALDFFSDAVAHTQPEDYGLTWQRMAALLDECEPDPLAEHVAVLGAIDMALWDLAGRKLGVPCHRLAGGLRAPRLDCTAGGLTVGQEGLDAAACRLRDQFGAVEIALSGDAAKDAPAIHRLRRVLGEMTPLMADAGTGYADPESARTVGKALEQVEGFWYENPLPSGQWSEYAALRESLGTGLAGGRSLCEIKQVQAALQAGAFDILVADLRRCGGPTAARRMADLAVTHRVRLTLHNGASPLAQLAASHVAAANWHVGPLQVEPTDSPLRELVTPAPAFQGGFITVPREPGLGAQVDEAVIQRYQVALPEE